MASTTTEGPIPEDGKVTPISRLRGRTAAALTAAATRITTRDLDRSKKRRTQKGSTDWQADAWDMYDLVGEFRFVCNTLAGRVAQAHLFAARLSDDPTEAPVPLETNDDADEGEGTATDRAVADAWAAFGGTPVQRAQMVARLAVALFTPGEGYVVGVPEWHLPKGREQAGLTVAPDPEEAITPTGEGDRGDVALTDLHWFALSNREVKTSDEEVTLTLGGDKVTVPANDVFLIRIWRPHPADYGQADSPTRSSLPVLRELVGLTMHISAQIDSRLAGAGVFFVPQSARDAVLAALGDMTDGEDVDPFIDSIMEAMITAIQDRSNASALVPIQFVVPDDSIEKFRHMTFSGPLDAEARPLRTEAIRRLSLGLDAPPELLTGVGGMNHWGAWLVKEETVTTHVSEPLGVLCDAFTSEYLHPVLRQQGMSEEEIRRYVVWYDVAHLIQRPDKSDDAKALYALGELTGDALRDATGFTDLDAPKSDPALGIALRLVEKSPQLLQAPGLPAVVEQVRAALGGDEAPTGDGTPPAPSGAPTGAESEGPPEEGMAASITWPEEWSRRPDVTVNVPPSPFTLNLPEGMVQMTVEPANVNVNVPEQAPPVVNMQAAPAPDVHVNVDAPPPAEVVVNVPEQAAPVVHVDAAPPAEVTVNVPAQEPPLVAVNVPEQAPPIVNVAPAEVTVNPTVESPTVEVTMPPAEVTVNVPEPKKRRTRTDIIRDDRGQISSVEGEEWA